VRCKKFKAAKREEEEYPHGSSTDEQRDRSLKDLYASGRGYYRAIDLAVAPDALPRRASLKSGKLSSLTRSRKKSHERGLGARGLRLKGKS
jgi:hypothetical protein